MTTPTAADLVERAIESALDEKLHGRVKNGNGTEGAQPSVFRSVVTGDPPALRDEALRDVVGRLRDEWSILILFSLSRGPISHRALTQLIPDVSSRVLTLTIRGLIADGLVERLVDTGKVLSNEYMLSPLGRSLLEPLQQLLDWAEHHRDALIAARAKNARG